MKLHYYPETDSLYIEPPRASTRVTSIRSNICSCAFIPRRLPGRGGICVQNC